MYVRGIAIQTGPYYVTPELAIDIPCHTQAVERIVKLLIVTEMAKT